MSILDRKPRKYSTSDLFWEPSAAPTDGAVGDINTMKLDPSHLGFAQDVIIDTNGVMRSRGGFQTASSDTWDTTKTLLGGHATDAGVVLVTRNLTGYNTLYGTATTSPLNTFGLLTASNSIISGSAQEIGGTGLLPTFATMSDNKGAVIAGDYGFVANGASNNLTCLWGGNIVTTSDTITGTAASTIGSTAVAGVGTAWTSALVGCYLFIGATTAAQYVGKVFSVTSTTALVLEKGALKTIAAAAPAFKTVRSTQFMVYKGRVTTSTTSAVVIGANTKFNSSGPLGSGSVLLTNGAIQSLFRYSDGAYVGTITSVQNDTTLTLTANAAIALTNEEYYITCQTFPVYAPGPQFYFRAGSVAKFADRYWYGSFGAQDPTKGTVYSPNSLAFTKKNDPECFDLDPSAGDIITLPPPPSGIDRIRGLCATRGGLVVFRTHDVFLITGYSPETFRAIKITDDGIALSISFKPYKDGVIWAGSKSMWYFDGTQVVDLLQNKMRRYYQRSCRNVDINSPTCVAISDDHVIVGYANSTAQSVTDRQWPVKNTTGLCVYINLVLNLTNGAVSFFTNLFITNSLYVDALGTTVLISRDNSGLANCAAYLIKGKNVFTDSSTAADNFDAISPTFPNVGTLAQGPNVMFETVKLSLGNAARLKFWKMVLFNYSSDVGMTAAFISTNDTTVDFPNRATGTAGTVTLPISSNVGVLKRIKFLVRSPSLMIRVYQTSTPGASSQRFKLFWYTVGGKWMRQGRQQ